MNLRYFLKKLLQKYEKIKNRQTLQVGEKGIFIDCGGYDGCSAVKFLLSNPHFDSITFEPNPLLWKYYKNVPTTLIKCGVSHKKYKTNFYLDEIDADGSSIFKEKTIIFKRPENNSHCNAIKIKCVEISTLIRKLSFKYKKIILKLDVEGAEYDVLENLIDQKIIKKVHKIYAEFHWQKCKISFERHSRLVYKIKKYCSISGWDGSDFAIHKRGKKREVWRTELVKKMFGDVKKYQKIKIRI